MLQSAQTVPAATRHQKCPNQTDRQTAIRTKRRRRKALRLLRNRIDNRFSPTDRQDEGRRLIRRLRKFWHGHWRFEDSDSRGYFVDRISGCLKPGDNQLRSDLERHLPRYKK